MIRIEEGQARQVRVIGSLQGPASKLLAEAISSGPIVLDLSDVAQADEGSVRLLAGLPTQRCAIVGCPTWLALWLDRMRKTGGERR